MMNCFPCFKNCQEDDEDIHNAHVTAQPRVGRTFTPQPIAHIPWATSSEPKVDNYRKDSANSVASSDIDAKQYTFRELATATKNFRQECLIGECGFGRIYKGTFQPSGQVVTVKRLDKNSSYGNEFLVEVLMLSLLRHSNLLNLVGYCADGDQRLLVYEYMPMGSVHEHLFAMDVKKNSLDWAKRMKIACGIAQGIEYLHDKANPSVIYRDLKCTNVMLDEDFNPKLSDHGLSRLGANSKSQVTVMGAYGYCAPEFEKHGQLTVKSDVYNFGVVLLELITGRAAVDTSKTSDEQHLVKWAQPIFKDPRRFSEMADPRLNSSFLVKSLNQAVGIAAMCLQDEPDVRPVISDVVAALTSLLAIIQNDVHVPGSKQEKKALSRKQTRNASRRDQSDYSGDSSDCSWSDYSDEEIDNDYQYDHTHAPTAKEIEYHKNQDDQKDIHMYEETDFRKHQYDQKDTRMAGEIGYRNNQDDQKETPMDKEISCHQYQYDQKDTHMDAKIAYHENQFDQKDISTDSESDTDEDQDEHRCSRTNEKIGCKESQSAQQDACMDTERGYNENYHEQNDRKIEESGSDYDSESSHEDTSSSSRQSSPNRSARLGSEGRNDMMLKDEDMDSYSRKSSNVGFDNESVYKRNQSIGSSYSWQSSIGRYGNGNVRSVHQSP